MISMLSITRCVTLDQSQCLSHGFLPVKCDIWPRRDGSFLIQNCLIPCESSPVREQPGFMATAPVTRWVGDMCYIP